MNNMHKWRKGYYVIYDRYFSGVYFGSFHTVGLAISALKLGILRKMQPLVGEFYCMSDRHYSSIFPAFEWTFLVYFLTL